MIDLSPACGCEETAERYTACRVHWHEMIENNRLGCPCCTVPSSMVHLWQGQ